MGSLVTREPTSYQSSQENVFLFLPAGFWPFTTWDLSPAQRPRNKPRNNNPRKLQLHHQICHENKISQPYPGSGGTCTSLGSRDHPLPVLCCQSALRIGRRSAALPGVSLRGNDRAGRFSGYLMTAPARMCQCCSHKAPQSHVRVSE